MDTLDELVGSVVEAMGLEFVDAVFGREGGRQVLRVMVDREGGVDLDTIAAASERVSRRLDVEDFGEGPYTLEVTSPGVERPLNTPDDFAKRIGEKVKVKTRVPVEGARSHTGELIGAGEETVMVATEQGERLIRHEDIASARTIFEWGSGK